MLEKVDCIAHLDNINDLCRLCLSSNCPLQDLFAFNPGTHNKSVSLIEKISDSTSIMIKELDELPTKVCQECCEQVERIHEFKQRCLAADSLLQKHVKHKIQSKVVHDGEEKCDSACDVGDKEVACSSGISSGLVCAKDSPGKLGFDPELLNVEIKEEEGMSDGNALSSSEEDVSKKISRSKNKNKSSHKIEKYTCQSCGKSFCNKYSLSRHKWSHSKKTLSCKYCKKIFTNQESWNRHEKMHQSGNRYQCHLCDKSYVSSTSHAAHIRKHTGERPYKCSDCDETFYLISSYERHIAKHRGVKDYKCEICTAAFWVADDLRAHVNRMH